MSIRVSLKQFQQDLSDRLQLATSQSSANSRLAVRIAEQNWLVSLADISEVITPSSFAPVPLTQIWFLGVTNIRGKLYSVVDLARFSGLSTAQRNIENRLLIIHPQFASNSALLVDQALGLRNIDNMRADGNMTTTTWSSQTYYDENGTMWHHLDIAALVVSNEFLTVSA
ncbi:MAG: chemotaxis protein CheW [Sulfuriferula sp.]|nr:chemotaxis protein CheW [Sulfuriferula sp.]